MALPEIQDVFVLPEQRRRGIASELTRAAEVEVRSRGWNSISLSVSQDGNPDARSSTRSSATPMRGSSLCECRERS